MATELIITQKRGRIGVTTLNRPESRNTSTVPFAEQLDQALSTMERDPDLLVVVINADGLVSNSVTTKSWSRGLSPSA